MRLLRFLEKIVVLFFLFFLESLKQTWIHYHQLQCLDFLIVQQTLFTDQYLSLSFHSNQLQLIYSNFWRIHNLINTVYYNLHLNLLLTFLVSHTSFFPLMMILYFLKNIFWWIILPDFISCWTAILVWKSQNKQSVNYYKFWFKTISILVYCIFILTFFYIHSNTLIF